MINDMQRKIIRALLSLFTLILLVVGAIIGWQYRIGAVTRQIAMFWFSMIAAIVSFVNFIYFLIIKETVVKGVTISKERFPTLYLISLVMTFVLFLLSVIGIYYYKRQ